MIRKPIRTNDRGVIRVNKASKIAIGLAVMILILLIATAIGSVASRQWKNLWMSFLAMACLTVPFFISHMANRINLILPLNFNEISLGFIFLAQYLGEILKFYQRFWWWDLFLHAIFGSFAVLIGLSLQKSIIQKKQKVKDKLFYLSAVIQAFSFSITLGTLWEMFEFVGDYFLKTGMVKGGLEDTATDLLVKIAAAFITSILCFHREYRTSEKITWG
jgi:putative membrane protein